MAERSVDEIIRSWHTDDPRRLVGRGHPVGDTKFTKGFMLAVIVSTSFGSEETLG